MPVASRGTGYEPKPTSMRENCKLNLEIFGLDGANGTFCAILGSRSTGWGLAWLARWSRHLARRLRGVMTRVTVSCEIAS